MSPGKGDEVNQENVYSAHRIPGRPLEIISTFPSTFGGDFQQVGDWKEPGLGNNSTTDLEASVR